MKLDIPYLNRSLHLDVPDENLLGVAEPNEIEVSGTPEEIAIRSLEHPFGPGGEAGQSLDDFLAGAESILVIVNDATRPTPTEVMLGVLLPVFRRAGISVGDISILVATGSPSSAD